MSHTPRTAIQRQFEHTLTMAYNTGKSKAEARRLGVIELVSMIQDGEDEPTVIAYVTEVYPELVHPLTQVLAVLNTITTDSTHLVLLPRYRNTSGNLDTFGIEGHLTNILKLPPNATCDDVVSYFSAQSPFHVRASLIDDGTDQGLSIALSRLDTTVPFYILDVKVEPSLDGNNVHVVNPPREPVIPSIPDRLTQYPMYAQSRVLHLKLYVESSDAINLATQRETLKRFIRFTSEVQGLSVKEPFTYKELANRFFTALLPLTSAREHFEFEVICIGEMFEVQCKDSASNLLFKAEVHVRKCHVPIGYSGVALTHATPGIYSQVINSQ